MDPIDEIAYDLDLDVDKVTIELRAKGRRTIVIHPPDGRTVIGEVHSDAELSAFLTGLRAGVKFSPAPPRSHA